MQRRLSRIDAKRAQEPPPVVIGFPQVLMILSCVMWTMYSIALSLKRLGFRWVDGWRLYFPIFVPLLNAWQALKLYWWPPPRRAKSLKENEEQQSNSKSQNCNKLLLTALAIAALKCDSLPHVSLSQDRALKQRIRSASHRGLLNTARLKPQDKALVRSAIQAMPAHLYKENDSKLWIVDTGCSDTATGYCDDFLSGTLQELDVPKPMDGVGGQLLATHTRTVSFEVLADNGTIHIVQTQGFYLPDLHCHLLSLQGYFIEQKKNGNTQSKLEMDHNGTALVFNQDIKATMPHDPSMRLLKLQAYKDTMKTAESLLMGCVSDEHNQNLSHRAKTLLRWHFKLGHIGFQ